LPNRDGRAQPVERGRAVFAWLPAGDPSGAETRHVHERPVGNGTVRALRAKKETAHRTF
jgi:hypothetical protein